MFGYLPYCSTSLHYLYFQLERLQQMVGDASSNLGAATTEVSALKNEVSTLKQQLDKSTSELNSVNSQLNSLKVLSFIHSKSNHCLFDSCVL